MSLLYLDFFSFCNTLSFIVSSVNNALLAFICSFLNRFLAQSQFAPRLLYFFISLFLSCVIEASFLISPLANFLSISSSLSKVFVISSCISTKVSPRLLYLFNNFNNSFPFASTVKFLIYLYFLNFLIDSFNNFNNFVFFNLFFVFFYSKRIFSLLMFNLIGIVIRYFFKYRI